MRWNMLLLRRDGNALKYIRRLISVILAVKNDLPFNTFWHFQRHS